MLFWAILPFTVRLVDVEGVPITPEPATFILPATASVEPAETGPVSSEEPVTASVEPAETGPVSVEEPPTVRLPGVAILGVLLAVAVIAFD